MARNTWLSATRPRPFGYGSRHRHCMPRPLQHARARRNSPPPLLKALPPMRASAAVDEVPQWASAGRWLCRVRRDLPRWGVVVAPTVRRHLWLAAESIEWRAVPRGVSMEPRIQSYKPEMRITLILWASSMAQGVGLRGPRPTPARPATRQAKIRSEESRLVTLATWPTSSSVLPKTPLLSISA